MNNKIELQDLQQALNKMNLLNINEAYPHFSKNGVVLYLVPCQKASFLYTKKQLEDIIRSKKNEMLIVV
jgi:hypothetical protein